MFLSVFCYKSDFGLVIIVRNRTYVKKKYHKKDYHINMTVLLRHGASGDLCPMQVFFAGSKSASDVALRFIDIKHGARLFCKRWIDLHQA